MIHRGLFVTGTDTGVGKTLVSVAILRAARRLGLRPVPFKPVETGCCPDPKDALALWRASGTALPPEQACLYPLPLPAAPAAAAAAANISLDMERIVAHADLLSAQGDFLLVEGAGGLLVPLLGSLTNADLAARLGLPVVIVGRTALGTINHVALTAREARRSNLNVIGVILSRGAEEIEPHESRNVEQITALTDLPTLATIPHVGSDAREDPDQLADVLTTALGPASLDRLLRASYGASDAARDFG